LRPGFIYLVLRLRLPILSSDTVSFFLPLARRRLRTVRPLRVFILTKKPCVLARFRFFG
jgi:hypothetical protein